MKSIIHYTLFACMFLVFGASGQTISGRVMSLDDTGNMEDLIGASVYFRPLKLGVLTDAKGAFQLNTQGKIGWLLFSNQGFQTDSVFVDSNKFLHIHLRASNQQLQDVKVFAKPGGHDEFSTIHTEILTMKTLAKAACCNLSESFETNASVSVNFSDAVTGAKQIQLLGLAGTYVQTNVENMPSVRGLKSTYGLNYLPGTWVKSIDLAKGQSSVVNGYESMTGAINVELAKPDTSEIYFLNTYANSQGRFEINQQGAHKFNSKLSTGIFTHYSQQASKIDGNGDGFLDLPLFQLINVLNRWKYASDHWMVQWGGNYLYENRVGGQTNFEPSTSARYAVYGFGSATSRLELFSKIARLFPEKPYKGLGLILSSAQHVNDSYFAYRAYQGREQSLYGNLIYQSIIDNTNHMWKGGASFLYDSYQESYLEKGFARTEMVPGVFGEYTWTIPNRLTMVLGSRLDWHNLYGLQYVPRIHAKWDIASNWIARASYGKGWRRVNYLAENMGFLVNQRNLQIDPNANPVEKAENFGATLTHNFTLLGRNANWVVDIFQTNFENQWIVDMENASSILMYSSPGKSFATSWQAEFNYSPIKRFELKAAYRYQDVQADYKTVEGQLSRLSKPFVNRDRVLVNLAYATPFEIWKFDLTWQWNGDRRIPDASPGHVHTNTSSSIQEYAPPFSTVYAQVTKQFKKWEMYVGGENLFNFTQANPIHHAQNPFSSNFDASMVWGPIVGRMIYVGMRYKIQ
ncbi:MAG: TonB-dependent receptor domain-containing protein [Aquirufa sp.]